MPIGAYVPVGDDPQGGCRPGAVALHEYVMDRWGDGIGSYGCYNPSSKAGSGWSLHREGRAIDVSVARSVKKKGDDIFHWAVRNADSLGLQEIQWYGQIWTSRRSQEGIRRDTSSAASLHYDHVHLGLAYGWTFAPPEPLPKPKPKPPYREADPVIGNPAVVALNPGVVHAFVRGTNNSLWHTFTSGGPWAQWENLGGWISEPWVSATVSAPGRVEIVVRGYEPDLVTPAGLFSLAYDGKEWGPLRPIGGAWH